MTGYSQYRIFTNDASPCTFRQFYASIGYELAWRDNTRGQDRLSYTDRGLKARSIAEKMRFFPKIATCPLGQGIVIVQLHLRRSLKHCTDFIWQNSMTSLQLIDSLNSLVNEKIAWMEHGHDGLCNLSDLPTRKRGTHRHLPILYLHPLLPCVL